MIRGKFIAPLWVAITPTSHHTTVFPSNVLWALENMERGKVKNELCGVELELKVLS